MNKKPANPGRRKLQNAGSDISYFTRMLQKLKLKKNKELKDEKNNRYLENHLKGKTMKK